MRGNVSRQPPLAAAQLTNRPLGWAPAEPGCANASSAVTKAKLQTRPIILRSYRQRVGLKRPLR